MKLQLFAISGSREGETFVVEDHSRVSFGRTAASDISFLEDGHMSSLHFEVVNHGERYEVRDCGSTNGTWLNNQRISANEIADGDLLKAGKSVLRVVLASSEQQPRKVSGTPKVDVDSPQRAPSADQSNSKTGPERRPPRSGGPIQFSMDGDPYASPPPEPVKPTPQSGGPIQFSVDGDPYTSPPARPSAPRAPTGNAASGGGGGGVGGAGGGSPIESLMIPSQELSPLLQPGMPPAPTSRQPATNTSDNPFSDSCDFVFQQPTPPTPVPKREHFENHFRGFTCLERKIQATVEEALALVLEKLMVQYSMRLVVHFQKIRIGIPRGLIGTEPLLDWFGSDEEGSCSPVMIRGEMLKRPEFASLLPRLCRADALMAFFGSEPGSLEAQIRSMMQTGVSGFAEEGGFLACCWPSSFMTLLDVSGNSVCQQLFGEVISGAVFCTPGMKQALRAYANPDLAMLLSETEFRERV